MIKRYVVLQDSDSIQVELRNQTALSRLDCLKGVAEAALENTEGQLDLKQIRKQTVAVVERDVIEKTLRSTHWNKWKAAQQLKVNYKTLVALIKEHQIGSRLPHAVLILCTADHSQQAVPHPSLGRV